MWILLISCYSKGEAYLTPEFGNRSRQVLSSNGCLQDDQQNWGQLICSFYRPGPWS